MSVRKKPHNGRDKSGHFRVKQADVEELQTDPDGQNYLRDDVKLGGAVADTGVHAGERGKRIDELENENRENVDRVRADSATGAKRPTRKSRSRKR